MCHGQKKSYIGDGHPTFNRNPYNGYMNPYYWVDDHPLLYGNNGSLDPGTNKYHVRHQVWMTPGRGGVIDFVFLSDPCGMDGTSPPQQ